jgi:hypothetical protein
MVGTVTDSSGAVVPSATVSITEANTGIVAKATTNGAGEYVFTLLHIGTYTVAAEQQGFQRTVQTNVSVGVNQVVRVDLVLQVGRTNQEVTVTAAPPQVESQASSLGTIETEQRIVDLPLNGRNFFQLAFLGPGADSGGQVSVAYGGGTDNNRPGMALAVNGLDNFNNNYLLDGVDNNEFGQGTVVVQPAPDAIEEFRVEENSMKAEFGRGGASVNLVIKSGANQVHGGAYEFVRNSDLDARNFFDANRAPFRRNQYGAYVGGPIKKDRTFLFGDFQISPIREGYTFLSTVPTAAERIGNFSDLGTPIYNPYTTDPETGERQLVNPSNPENISGSSLINSVGQAVMNLFPTPTPGLTGTTNNYLLNPSAVTNAYQYDIRLDHHATDRDQLFFHDAFQQVNFLKPAPLGPEGGCCNGYGSNIDGRYQSWGAGWTHTLTPSLVNDLHGSFLRFRLHSLHVDSGENRSEALGIPNANRGDKNSSGLSLFFISGIPESMGDAPYVPEIATDNTYQIGDTLSWIKGGHTIKFGVDFRRRQRNFFQAESPMGQFWFGGQFSSDPLLGGGNGLADLLLGIPVEAEQDTLAFEDPTRYWDWAGFAQDDYRVTSKLTLNLGFRYDLFSPVSGKVGNFNFTTASVIDNYGTGAVPHGGVLYDKKDVGPRVGFAYTPFGNKKTVVRSAFGMFYAPEGNAFNDLGENPPNLEFYLHTYSPSVIPTTAQLISSGFPATMPTSSAANPEGQVKTSGPVHLLPRILEWNFNIEQQLAPSWVLEVGYVGTRGTRIWDNETDNFDQPYQPLDSNFSDTTGNYGRPYFNVRPLLNTIYPIDYPHFDIMYNALDVKVNKHFSQGFNVLFAYTWSKNLGTNVGLPGNAVQMGVQDPWNVSQEKGYVGADIANRFVASYLYQLPYGHGKHFGSTASRPLDMILGGWELSGITMIHGGEHETAYTSTDYTNTGTYGPWPDKLHNPADFSFNKAGQAALGCSQPGKRTLDCWYNPAAFIVPPLAAGQNFAHQYGDGGNGSIVGPGQVNFDMALLKRFKPTESTTLEVRGEFFNAFNHPQFALPNMNPDVQGGASVVSTLQDNQREIQLGLKLSF